MALVFHKMGQNALAWPKKDGKALTVHRWAGGSPVVSDRAKYLWAGKCGKMYRSTELTSMGKTLYCKIMSVKVSAKYQVVIPESVRSALNIKAGAEMDVIAKGGIVYLVPIRPMAEIKKRIAGKISAADQKTLREKKDRDL